LPRLGAEEEVEVVGHEVVPEEPEGVAPLGRGECPEQGEVVVVIGEDGGAVVAAVERVIDQTVVGGAGKSSHGRESNGRAGRRREKRTDTIVRPEKRTDPIFRPRKTN